ncbi:MAG: hypothetical protein QGF81_01105 [Dehalococcoidia bacterium]|nr:hypothetical protein [Dehalococcoidia bacterium]
MEAVNFFVVQPQGMSAITAQDSRLFIVPMNTAGTEPRAVLVDQLSIERGPAKTPWPGVLVVTAEA